MGKRLWRRVRCKMVMVGLLSWHATASLAHPHVFAEARLNVVVDDSQSVAALRHLWRFDDAFSSTVLLEFDRNGDLELSLEELDEVAGVVHESLAEFGYFQFVTVDGADVAMHPPERLIADMHDNQLIILFESQPEEHLAISGLVAFGVYDPTFYTAIDFTDDEMMQIENLPAACSTQVIRPDPDEAIAQNQHSLTEDFFDPSQPVEFGKIFATRLEVRCPGK